jgi:hypothetical protein
MSRKKYGGGRAYHSVLEKHFEFIRALRKQRRTWKEVSAQLLSEKGIQVTLYAPYFFYRRRLKQMREHPELGPSASQEPQASPDSPRPKLTIPVLPGAQFRKPDRKTFEPERYL